MATETGERLRLPWGFDRITEYTFPVHDPPAVWKSWGLRGGGLPIVEALHGAPVTRPRYGATADDGLPTLHRLQSETRREDEEPGASSF